MINQTQAFVIADPLTLDGQVNILSPRQILKTKLAQAKANKLDLQLKFSVNFLKNAGKDDQPSPFHTVDLGAIKSNWATNASLKSALDSLLRGMGIPVVQIDQLND
jgi:glutamine synthetase